MRLDKQRFISLIKEPSLKFIDYASMQEVLKNGAILLDVRSQDDYEQQHLKGSISAPFFSLRMQLKTLSHQKPVVVVCQNGKVSEAAAFLLLRHKIEAMILKGGIESLTQPNFVAHQQKDARFQEISFIDNSTSLLEDQISVLKMDNEVLKNTNQQLKDKCMKLEFDKQYAEKQCRILHKQMEKLTQILDKLQQR